MVYVETRGNPQAYNPDEDALGPFQIRPCYLADVNIFRRAKGLQPYTRHDCTDMNKALDMVREYTSTYAKRLHRPWTAETIARTHVGGPKGPDRKSSLTYWNLVKEHMQ